MSGDGVQLDWTQARHYSAAVTSETLRALMDSAGVSLQVSTALARLEQGRPEDAAYWLRLALETRPHLADHLAAITGAGDDGLYITVTRADVLAKPSPP